MLQKTRNLISFRLSILTTASVFLFVLTVSGIAAATDIDTIRYSTDTSVSFLSGAFHDEIVITDDLGGTLTPVDLGSLPLSTDVDAYHLLPNGDQIFSVEQDIELAGGVVASAGDIVRYNGAAYSLEFQSSAFSVKGANIDAISADPNGALLISFDVTVDIGGVTAGDEDLVLYDGSQFSLFFDGSVEGVDSSLDVDAAHYLEENGHLLLSFDTSGAIGGVNFDDEDVLEFDPGSGSWELVFDGSTADPAWTQADLDALHATSVVTCLPPPMSPIPANGASLCAPPGRLSWTPAPGADYHTVDIDGLTSFDCEDLPLLDICHLLPSETFSPGNHTWQSSANLGVYPSSTCSSSGPIWTFIVDPDAPPSDEICDGLDNDCNGLTDEIVCSVSTGLVRNNNLVTLDPTQLPSVFDPNTGQLLGSLFPQVYQYVFHREPLVQAGDGPLVMYQTIDPNQSLSISTTSTELFIDSSPGDCRVVHQSELGELINVIPVLLSEHLHAFGLFGVSQYQNALVCEGAAGIISVKTFPVSVGTDRMVSLLYLRDAMDSPSAFITVTWADKFDFYSWNGGLRYDVSNPANPAYVALDASGDIPVSSLKEAALSITATCEEVGLAYHNCIVTSQEWLDNTQAIADVALYDFALPQCAEWNVFNCAGFGAIGFVSLLAPLTLSDCKAEIQANYSASTTSCPVPLGSDPACLYPAPNYGICHLDFGNGSPYCEYPKGSSVGACEGVGECGPGSLECDGTGGATCSTDSGGSADQSSAEVCDGLDNDCDGLSDDGFSIGSVCNGLGECGVGVRECSGNGGVRCSSDPGGSNDQSRNEFCDGLDNDCDGTTDDGIPVGGPCGVTDEGECSLGVTGCSGGGPVCNENIDPVPEVCDSLDNDCDGTPDNGFSLGSQCQGEGECGFGFIECNGGGGVRCSTEPGGSNDRSVSEICDYLDNDCDGVTDEDCAPDPPTLIAPVDGSSVSPGQDVTFTWNTSSGAGRYRLKFAQDAAMSVGVLVYDTIPDGQTSWTVPATTFAAGQTYYWQVGAIAPGDVGGWGVYGPTPPWSFTVTQPAPPTLIAPGNGSTVPPGQDMTFTWNTSSGAGRYRLKIAQDAAMSVGVTVYDTIPDGQTSWTVSAAAFSAGQPYYWQVAAIAPGDIGGWGVYGPTPPWSFTVTQPAPPTLIAPGNGSSLPTGQNITFSWTASSGAGRYRVKIARDAAMSVGVIVYDTIPDGQTSWTVSAATFSAGQTYYWQVGAIAPGDVGGWGVYGPTPPWSFTVAQPTPPTLIAPSNGTTIPPGQDITFSWGSASGAGRYRLKIAQDAAMSVGVMVYDTIPDGQTSWTVSAAAFTVGQTYYWQVGAIAPGDVGGWGVYGPTPPWSFTVTQPAPPALVGPTDGSTIPLGQNVTFQWSSSPGAARYMLKITTDPGMTNNVPGSPFEPPLGQTGRTVPASTFAAGQTYYWQVRAIAPNDIGGWGAYGPVPPWSFTISSF